MKLSLHLQENWRKLVTFVAVKSLDDQQCTRHPCTLELPLHVLPCRITTITNCFPKQKLPSLVWQSGSSAGIHCVVLLV